MRSSFYGGIHPEDGKNLTAHKAIEVLPPPAQVTIPLNMHIGATDDPLVAPGDRVLLGQIIGRSDAPVSVPIHASVSGTVSAVEPRLHPNGNMVPSIVIDNDGLDEPMLLSFPENPSPTDIIDIIRDSGVVGMGGAAFPTHFKISSALGKVDTIIINAAECEPFITADHRIILENTDEFIEGVRILIRAVGINSAIIAIEANKRDAIKLLKNKLADSTDISVRVLKTRYPQGSEKQLIQAVTRRLVPPGKLPADVACVVFNVFSAWSVNHALSHRIPAIDRIVTASGPGFIEPKNLRVRIGTPLSELISAAGGLRDNTTKLLLGGPMMGSAVCDTSVPIIRGTNAITALLDSDDRSIDNPTCIRCGKCVDVCPMRLLPVYMFLYERNNDIINLRKLNPSDCMECGSCAYVCPGRLPLVQAFRNAKRLIRS